MLPAVLETFSDGSYRSVVLDPILDPKRQSAIRKSAKRSGDPGAYLISVGTPCWVVEYEVPNRGSIETYRLVTSILDPAEAPAHDLATLYHERWEIELAFDEIEIHQLGHGRVLRSKSPEMVRQEIWVILLAHYAIRHLMHEAADTADVDRSTILHPQPPRHPPPNHWPGGISPNHSADNHFAVIAEIIEIPNPKRRHRGYLRVVKRYFTESNAHTTTEASWYPGPPKIHILPATA